MSCLTLGQFDTVKWPCFRPSGFLTSSFIAIILWWCLFALSAVLCFLRSPWYSHHSWLDIKKQLSFSMMLWIINIHLFKKTICSHFIFISKLAHTFRLQILDASVICAYERWSADHQKKEIYILFISILVTMENFELTSFFTFSHSKREIFFPFKSHFKQQK